MEVKDNKDIQKQVAKLAKTVSEAAVDIEFLDFLANKEKGEERDAVNDVRYFRERVFELRGIMFNAKMELDKITKAMDKHVAHCLNPIERTAPKQEKIAARKKKDASELAKLFAEPPKILKELETKIHTIKDTLDARNKMNEIMPGKEGYHPTKITINKKGTVKLGNSPLHNPIHENDKPFE